MIIKDIIPHHDMQFAPVEDDDDELTNAIREENERSEDRWQLNEEANGEQLSEFWDDALNDLAQNNAEE